jgi:hypothetical protein
MDNLKTYTQQQFFDDLTIRIQKIPLLSDIEELKRCFKQCIRDFDEVVFLPRHVLIKNAVNGAMVDVTDFHIDEINRVYFSNDSTVNAITGELGILPFISAQGGSVGMLDSLIDFFVMQRVINGLKRYTNTFDWELWPPDENGRLLLQVRNPGSLIIVDFIPYFDADIGSWELFAREKSFIDELFYRRVNLQNMESQAQALPIGGSKEAQTLVQYWEKRVDDHIKDWKEKASIISVY